MKKFLVGGAVRDMLMGIVPKDRDWVVVGETPESMLALGYEQVGKDFPVFLHPETKEEYALARKERKVGNGHTGFECVFTPDITLEDDLFRRDLTINAIAYDVDTGEFIDPYGGRKDIENRTLKAVSHHFAEDPLRVLRVARFVARYGFDIDYDTFALMKEIIQSGEFASLSLERIVLEMEKAFKEPNPEAFIDVLFHCDGLEYVFGVEHKHDLRMLFDQAAGIKDLPNASLMLTYLVFRLTDLDNFLDKFDQVLSKDTKHLIKLCHELHQRYNLVASHFYMNGTILMQQTKIMLQKMDFLRRPDVFDNFVCVMQKHHENDYGDVEFHESFANTIRRVRDFAVMRSREYTATLADSVTPVNGKAIKEQLNITLENAIIDFET